MRTLPYEKRLKRFFLKWKKFEDVLKMNLKFSRFDAACSYQLMGNIILKPIDLNNLLFLWIMWAGVFISRLLVLRFLTSLY